MCKSGQSRGKGGCYDLGKEKSQYCQDIIIDECSLPCEVARVGKNRLSASVHGLYYAYSKLCRFVAGFNADTIVRLNTSMKDITVMLKIT